MSDIRRMFSKLAAQGLIALAAVFGVCAYSLAAKMPLDPGVRGGVTGAGGPLPGLTRDETAFFQDGLTRFVTVESVGTGANSGLGPRFNSNSCLSCHAYPSVGGSSPASNPLIEVATFMGARNTVPWFITAQGPVREARFKQSPNGIADGSVYDLFVITGSSHAGKCNIAQPDFRPAGNPLTGQGGNSNIVFRIPTPIFGAGLIEAIPDAQILANMAVDVNRKKPMGISGHPNAHQGGSVNRNAADGTITRFGWKAQTNSLLMFSGEAYNIEMGVTNQLFPQEREEAPECALNPTPEDATVFASPVPGELASDIVGFANFMRLLAPPAPAPDTLSTQRGREAFISVGCALCHTPSFTTAGAIASGSPTRPSTALSNQVVNLWSDLLLHHMGKDLADGITQGAAGPDEFRTPPLWGLGQRIFFLHDGRTKDLLEAIDAHKSRDSEANRVIDQFHRLHRESQQDIVNFLRGL